MCCFCKLQDDCPDIYSALENGEQSDTFCTTQAIDGKDKINPL